MCPSLIQNIIIWLPAIFLIELLQVPPADACNSTETCDYPADNPYTADGSATRDGRRVVNGTVQDCCAQMPRVPLLDTGIGAHARVVEPPSMKVAGAVCPQPGSDIVIVQGLNPWRNGTLYKRPKIFFAEGLQHDAPGIGHYLPHAGLSGCQKPHPFYSKYLLARSKDCPVEEGIPILGSPAAPDASLVSAGNTIAEMLRQMDAKLPGLRREMAQHAQRFAVWADSERRTDTCEICTRIDPTFDCGAHIDSRAGRDTSYHPEVPMCNEGGGGSGIGSVTSYTEEYGIPYLESNGSIRASYCGTNIVAHEFFHSIHEVGIQNVARPLFMKFEQAAARAVEEGLYVHHPGARDDGCNPDFTRCVTYEFICKAQMLWNGFPSDRRELVFQSRKELKEKAPWIAELVFAMFEDGDWNPAEGAVITEPRDQTFGLTCLTAPGSALCGRPLGKDYIGPSMEHVLARCGGSCWDSDSSAKVVVV